jgi:hypothetical protein
VTRCQHCHRPTQLYLCQDCQDQLADMLDQLPWLITQLDITAQRQDQLAEPNTERTTTSPAELTVINFNATELARQVRATLLEWVARVAERHSGRRPPCLRATDTKDLARWLTANLSAIPKQAIAGQLYTAIHTLTGDHTNEGQIHQAINRQDRRYYGPCQATIGKHRDGTPRPCGQDLYAPPQSDSITCPRCNTQTNPQTQLLTTIKQRDLVTETQLLEALHNLGEPITRPRLYQWIKQGQLQPRGWIHNGRIVPHKIRHKDPRVFSLSQARDLRSKHQPKQEKTG